MEWAKKAGMRLDSEPWNGERTLVVGDTARLKAFAKLVREAALEEAAFKSAEFAQRWWSKHCATNKHMETTRAAHDDFCLLQAQLRSMKYEKN